MKAKANDSKENGENGEPADLKRLATDGIDCCHGKPITWNETSTRKDKVANTVIVKSEVRASDKRRDF